MAEAKYMCTVCKNEIENFNFSSVISCPHCSSKIFLKKPRKGKIVIKCE